MGCHPTTLWARHRCKKGAPFDMSSVMSSPLPLMNRRVKEKKEVKESGISRLCRS